MLTKIIQIIFGILLCIFGVALVATQQFMGCIGLSVFLFFCPILVLLVEWIARLLQKGLPMQQRRGIGSTALMYTVCFMAAACLLRYAVSGWSLQNPSVPPATGDTPPLPTVGVQLMEALFRSIRSVGILEDYADLIASLKEMWGVLYPGRQVFLTVMVHYATVLNIAIPVAGSTLILGMFAQIFPRLLLRLKYKNPFRREKCYFSALNVQSLALAKSILLARKKEHKWILPLLIFTDAYVDDESEQSYELMLEAKRLGAVCVRDDLSHVPKTRYGERKYFLMEEEEYANLPTLMGLMEEHNVPYIKNVVIYLFVQTDLYVRLEQNIHQQLRDRSRGKKALKEEELPAIIPVNAHRNLVNNLMVDVPLYEPLVGKDKNQLSITIFGNGSIGTEAFLSAYWFGQMMVCRKNKMDEDVLTACETTIHVVSQDDEETFWAKIDSINPDIRRTTQEGDPLLEWRDGQFNRPYCLVKYHKADAKMGKFVRSDATEGTDSDKNTPDKQSAEWLDADYVIVALGSDADNIAVANKLRAHIGKDHLEEKESENSKNTVIAYVVYNSELCQALNARTDVEYGIYMHAFGHLDQVYSSDNVFMTKTQLLAEEAHKAYHGHGSDADQTRNGKKEKPSRTYDQLADMARAMHVKYKLFSLGWITTSLFTASIEDHQKAVEEARAQYKRVAVVGKMHDPLLYAESPIPPVKKGKVDRTPLILSEEDQEKWKDLCKKRHLLAWLEHRRWCAYTRTMGFRSTNAMDKYYLTENNHKNMSLKLHPCLVEARHPAVGNKHTYVFSNEAFWKMPEDDPTLWEVDPDADALDIHHIRRWRAMMATWDIMLGMQIEADDQASDKVKADVAKRRKRIQRLGDSMGSTDHCKKFDYFIGEFPTYVLGSEFCKEMARYLDVTPDRWEKQCQKWVARGAFTCTKGDKTEWVIPEDCVIAYMRRRYPLTMSVKTYGYGYAVRDEVIPEPFTFAYRNVYYAKATWKNKRLLKRMKDECEKAYFRPLLERQEEKAKAKANATSQAEES